MDFDERGDQEEEIGMAFPPGYDTLGNSSAARSKIGPTSGGEGAASAAPRKVGSTIRYRECLKNHAVSIGEHAVDGCGEFIAAGNEGTLDALKCAACNCHRNFHRKEADGEGYIYNPHHHQNQHHPQISPYYRTLQPAGYLHLTQPPQHRPLALPAASGGGGGGIAGGYSREDEDVSNPSSSGGGGGGSGGLKKRFRTKFTPEQKDKMLSLAERLGWRIQKHDEAAVEQFCEESGVTRRVLKVWMHNNKHTLGKKP